MSLNDFDEHLFKDNKTKVGGCDQLVELLIGFLLKCSTISVFEPLLFTQSSW